MSNSSKRRDARSPGVTRACFSRKGLALCLGAWSLGFLLVGSAGAEPDKLLFGDTHLHSNNSFDAYLNRNYSADPATAYRYAQGYPVIHPYHRARVQIGTPLARVQTMLS